MISRLFCKPPPPATQVAPRHRIYAVGDVHGRADLLEDLLDRIAQDMVHQTDARVNTCVFLGDYIDRGDHSKEVLNRLMTLGQAYGPQPVFLLGNHEAALLSFLEDPVSGARWLDFGGDRTLRSYGVAPPQRGAQAKDLWTVHKAFKDALGPHLTFLTGLDRFWQSGDFVFVHAALNPKLPLEEQRDADLLWGNRAFLRGRGRAGIRVVHGHYDDVDPVVKPDRICIDTGAYYSDRLTAVCIDDDIRFLHTA